jgi:hypothetical protein
LHHDQGLPLDSTSTQSGFNTVTSLQVPQEPVDLRRLSVNSLLASPLAAPYQNTRSSDTTGSSWQTQQQNLPQEDTVWGIDRGFKDLDIGKNDDANAISGASPVAMRDHFDLVLDNDGQNQPTEFGFGTTANDTAFKEGGYYDKPVSVSIPRILEPLPSKLLENRMNLLVSNSGFMFGGIS